MTDPHPQKHHDPALDAVIDDLRRERIPPMDTKAVEDALFARLDAAPLPVRRFSPVVLLGGGGLALAAAAAAFFLLGRAPDSPRGPSQAAAPVPAAPVAMQPIRVGAAPAQFHHAGLADWTLAPHARAALTEEADRITVRLDEGTVDVDVVPSPVAERFVVLVGDTRVAVRGTRFRVARRGDAVDVDVSRGVVAVGSTGAPGTATWMLTAPRGGSFRTDGTTGSLRDLVPFEGVPAQVLEPRTPPAAPPGKSTALLPGQPSARAEGSTIAQTPPAPPVPPPLDAAQVESRARAIAAECFEKSARLSPNVNLTVTTQLALTFDASGALGGFTFDPPLAPAVTACVRDGLSGIRGATGSPTFALTLASRR